MENITKKGNRAMTIKQFTKKIIKATDYNKSEYDKVEWAVGIMFACNKIGKLVGGGMGKIVFDEQDIIPAIKEIKKYIKFYKV